MRTEVIVMNYVDALLGAEKMGYRSVQIGGWQDPFEVLQAERDGYDPPPAPPMEWALIADELVLSPGRMGDEDSFDLAIGEDRGG